MERLLRALPSRPQPLALRLGVTVTFVGLCFLALVGLHSQAELYWVSVLYPAVVLAAIVFDRASGFIATGLGAALLFLLMVYDSGTALTLRDAFVIAIFVLIASGLAAISDGLRVGWERAVAAERTKDLLLRELGHRIRNNLAMAVSLLMLQARSEKAAETRGALERASMRVRALADAHDHLEAIDHNGRIEMRDYLGKLCNHLREHLGGVRPIGIDVEADETALRTEEAIAVGLIVNELVTNAVKHAFPNGRRGRVRVTIAAGPPLVLTVEDDGIGCPPQKLDGLGSRLLHLLVQQVRGTIVWEEARPGCRVRLTVAPAGGLRMTAAPPLPVSLLA